MTTICGNDYKCKKHYKEGHCSYTKGKIYHSSRDGYVNDDLGVSWSCDDEFFVKYFNQTPVVL